ncbi:MAG: response regulator transcription factor [Campylobacteraceae bacterium]|nr:response regulator transcription factor [Campylobacteraceae bacterium]
MKSKSKTLTRHILLLEDDEILAQTLVQLLKSEGYDVVLADDGEEALDITYKEKFDLYLLDINVPLLNGMDFLKLSRDAGDKTPAFFITALRDLDSLSKAFDSGCDDYIKKPFDVDELLIRIKSILKKKNPVILYKNIKFDLYENRVYQNDKEIPLGSVEKAIFALLIANIGITINKSSLFDEMLKPSDLALRVLINKLRKTLDVNIINLKSVGYKLEKL